MIIFFAGSGRWYPVEQQPEMWVQSGPFGSLLSYYYILADGAEGSRRFEWLRINRRTLRSQGHVYRATLPAECG